MCVVQRFGGKGSCKLINLAYWDSTVRIYRSIDSNSQGYCWLDQTIVRIYRSIDPNSQVYCWLDQTIVRIYRSIDPNSRVYCWLDQTS